MHGPEIVPPRAATTPEDVNGVLNFLWLELTNRCDLQCIHCYTESGPHTGGGDILTPENYEDLMSEAHELGCKKIQFIGGEPQLNPQFKRLLRFSTEVGFDFIEVFSNLTKLDEETLEISVENGVHFRTIRRRMTGSPPSPAAIGGRSATFAVWSTVGSPPVRRSSAWTTTGRPPSEPASSCVVLAPASGATGQPRSASSAVVRRSWARARAWIVCAGIAGTATLRSPLTGRRCLVSWPGNGPSGTFWRIR